MPANLNIHHLFEQQQELTPDLIAVSFGNQSITYSELNHKATVLSRSILVHSPSSRIIGISTTRSIEMIIGVLAILKAGKAYLPLDPKYPQERLQQIIFDADVDICLCTEEELPFYQTLGIAAIIFESIIISSNTVHHLFEKQLAYVLYTSGSTGKPKGVAMGHEALVNLLEWQKQNSVAGAGTKTLQFAPLGFDVSFQEIFATLTTGGTLVMVNDELLLEPQQLLNFIDEQGINRIFLPFVALQYLTEAADVSHNYPKSIQEVITAGEQLKVTPQVARFFVALPSAVLYNQYGPTECHVVTSLKLKGNAGVWPVLPSIGQPINNVSIYMLDDNLQQVKSGEEGELCIAGTCLAEGYINHPDLTAEKFIDWKHPERGEIRIYKTGDVARYLPDGNIEFLGRKDDQVKILGYRIEPGEIEVLLTSQEGIRQAVVLPIEDTAGNKRLVAYLVSSNKIEDTTPLRKIIEDQLPYYMMPSGFVWLKELPKTPSGKVDKKALPRPDTKRPNLDVLYKIPTNAIEKNIAGVWASLLSLDKVGVDDNFFELGGNSLLAVKTVAVLKQRYSYNIQVTKLYQFPTVSGIAALLDKENLLQPKVQGDKTRNERTYQGDIAVISMAGRFPGANTIDELWELLKEGKETTSFFTKEELDPYLSQEVTNNAAYVAARGLIDGADEFDPAFFGINPKMAELMDPQQRIFLEIAWEALEVAGYANGKYDGSLGVFAGSGNNTYYLNNVLSNKELVDNVGGFQVMTLNEKDYVATRTAYALNLKGPGVSVHSGCSTSLLAIAQAADSIRNGQCDIALAGGVAITAPLKSGHIYQEGAMFSRDGHTRPFDAAATGTVFSDGAGIVLLKRKEDAIKDGDTIYALIKGVGLNNDGGDKGVFTAPSAEGQAGAIQMAINASGINTSSISYIEAHGTATPLGDPIEMEGLNMAFGQQEKKQYCAIGSIKSNMGHLTAAAGVAGFIKTALALHHRLIPASINYDTPNPNIDFKQTPFFVNTSLRKWDSVGSRLAGVSSFGVGGTNVHVILEGYDNVEKKSSEGRAVQLLCWSAKNEASRDNYAVKLSDYLHKQPQLNLADAAYTLHLQRTHFYSRRFVVASGAQELLHELQTTSEALAHTIQGYPSGVVFMFPGQGSQFLNMGYELYKNEPVFRQAIDECALLLSEDLKEDIFKIIYTEKPDAEASERLNNTFYTQPAIFSVEYALAKLWMSWGIKPTAFIGHSIGEFVAAHLAGIFSLKDALHLVATRGRFMAGLSKGSMLSVKAPHEVIAPLLTETISLASINSPELCAVAGTIDDIAAFQQQLEGQGIQSKLLLTSHAFHSYMMDAIVEPFEEVVKNITLSAPQIPVVSTVTGKWMTVLDATSPFYWASHLRATVNFAEAMTTLLADADPVLIECGPGNVTTTLAHQNGLDKSVVAVPSMLVNNEQSVYYDIFSALGKVWLNGVEPDWNAFYAGQKRHHVNLPTYAFDKKKYWVNPVPVVSSLQSLLAGVHNLIGAGADTQPEQEVTNRSRKEVFTDKVKKILMDASGYDIEEADFGRMFIEMGFDSLLLTEVAIKLRKEFNVPISFRQLYEKQDTINNLVAYFDEQVPADAPVMQQYNHANKNINLTGIPDIKPEHGLNPAETQQLMQYIARLQGGKPAVVAATAEDAAPSAEELVELKKPFGATARIEKQTTELSEKQQEFLADLTKRYNAKTIASKNFSQEHRAQMADPRVVSGFRPATKEIVYPIVVNKSKGSRVWDIDGNEYVDALNGFGSNFFGYQPDFLTKALKDQIDKGYEIGPQHELTGDVSKLVCEFTGADRAAFCNTGSEAVLGAMRMARTVTGRSLIVAFSGSYHGIVDEVIVRGTQKLKSFPAAPGIMPEAVQNMLILDYGTDEALKIIKDRADEIAAVMVEPVQSRRPDFQPVEFLQELRKVTEASGTALIFDEVITGFRMHPGGAQAIFGVKADLGTYGKVVGGGLSIGVIAGKAAFMDALDGGYWQFGDDSKPESGVTYFAGTFVRHPLALAAAKASLQYMKQKGAALQDGLNEMTTKLAAAMNAVCKQYDLPFYVPHFGSLWKIKFYNNAYPYGELIFTLMREKGVHIWDIFPCFLTEAHTTEDVDFIVAKFIESVDEMRAAGFFISSQPEAVPLPPQDVLVPKVKETAVIDQSKPPVAGARLGRDKEGNPAWFIADPERPGKYIQVA